MNDFIIFKSNGFYLGFVRNNNLFSTNGIYMGWVEGNFVWDKNGQFRGTLIDMSGHKYILAKRFTMLPVPRVPRVAPVPVVPPPPPANIAPITLPVEYQDAF